MSVKSLRPTRKGAGGAALVCALLVGLPAIAADGPRAVVELFTSQGCSSCPPADRLIGELATDPSIVALTFPIDYWDYLGWKDTLAHPKFTARQRGYAHKRGDREVYTPQAVVNGAVHALGSDRVAIVNAVAKTRKASHVMVLPVSLMVNKDQIAIAVAPEANAVGSQGEVWICAIAKEVFVNIGRGENRGREVAYHNVVRRWLKVGDWTGKAEQWSIPLENIGGDDVDSAVVYVQEGTRDKPGAMLGASIAPLRASAAAPTQAAPN